MAMRKLGIIGTVVLFLYLVFIFLLFNTAAAAQSQTPPRTGSLSLGMDIGLQGATADATAFALGLRGDYFLSRNFSVGPLLQIGITDDLFQIGPTVQGKFTFDLPDMPELKLHLQGGIGFIYADLDRRNRPDRDDTSFLVPIGFGAEYRPGGNVSFGSSLLFNFTDLEDVRNENFFVTWFVGMSFHF